MNFNIFLVAVLSTVAVAQPSHHHRHRHGKREAGTTTQVTNETEVAIAYVYENTNQPSVDHGDYWRPSRVTYRDWGPPGEHVASSAPGSDGASAQSAAPSYSSRRSSLVSLTPQGSQAPAPSSYSLPATSLAPPPSNSGTSGSGPGTNGLGYGISYAAYTNGGGCKSADQVKRDFDAFDGLGFVRIYSTDCEQVPNVLNAASSRGMKVFAGIWDINEVSSEAQAIIDAAKGNWNAIDTVSVGNELVNNGASADSVVSAIAEARSLLSAAGYSGRVVTVDTVDAIVNNQQLCEASDFAAANCHAFFNSDLTPDAAGKFVKEEARRVSQICGGKSTVITESGWPWRGESNGNAVASKENQATALDSLRSSFSGNIVFFSAFDDLWKTNNANTFNAEQYWGIYNSP